MWRLSDLVIDVGRQRVMRGDRTIELPKLSFDLLLALVRASPNVLSNEDLLEQVWPGLVVNPETVVQRVKLLRDALDDRAGEPGYVIALRGRGYRLASDAVRVDDYGTPGYQSETAGPSRPNRRAAILAAAAAAVLVSVAAAFWILTKDRAATEIPAEEAKALAAPPPEVAAGWLAGDLRFDELPELRQRPLPADVAVLDGDHGR